MEGSEEMTKEQANALLALIADLYRVINAPEPAPPESQPHPNGVTTASEKVKT